MPAHRALRAVTFAAVLACALLTGCGGQQRDDEARSASPSPTTTVTVTTTPSPTNNPTVRSRASLPPPITGTTVERLQVSSPSGNIWCFLDGFVECVIFENDYPAMTPEDCGGVGDWSDDRFNVTPGGGSRGSCASDTPFGDGRPPPLAYGATAVSPGQACQSLGSGMTCWDRTTGHGVRLSRASYVLF